MTGSTSGEFVHASVLLRETLGFLAPRPGGIYADATLGGGGHAESILDRSAPDGRLIGIDRDRDALSSARGRLARFGDRVVFVHGRMGRVDTLRREASMPELDGIVADLGVSSPQLDRPERGFSFRHDGPLDMRMDPSEDAPVRELIASLSTEELADILFTYGEERKSRPIARSIHRAQSEGELETTADLQRAVHRAVGGRRGPTDPATRTFQALRIAVNEELNELEQLLESLPDVLADRGVATVISFHSLEDRMVKRAFRDQPVLEVLTKKPVVAGTEERAVNPRARSAKLRAARRRPRDRAEVES